MTNSTFNVRVRIPAVLSILGALTLTLACDPGAPEGEGEQERAAALDPAVEVQSNPAIAPAEGSLEQRLMALQPAKTRAGWLRFTDPLIYSPGAVTILLARLDAAEDPPAIRAAVAEAIGRTGADYAAQVSARLPNESDARVRELLVGSLGRRAPSADAHPGLLVGLEDDDATVRAAAARVLASRPDGAEFSAKLITLLGDSEVSVRADAARTLGVLQVDAARESLTTLLSDDDAEVRLNSLRAISRINPAAAAQLDLSRLAQDDDPRIARLAAKI